MIFKIGCCQMGGSLKKNVNENKEETRKKAEMLVRKAALNGCDFAALPEMWNTPYSNEYFRAYAEKEDGPTVEFMSRLAEELSIYLIGGSIAELEGDKVYNTSYVFDRKGKIIAKHRKVHLFDIDVEGGIRFMESDTLSSGENITLFDTEFGKMGVAICFDVRFPEMFRKMVLEGANMIFLPAAFNLTTGPAHWELTMRMRALDNQCYFAAISPARNVEAPYQAYGHTLISDPWGNILSEAKENENIVYADIDLERLESIRRQLPLLKARRPEIY